MASVEQHYENLLAPIYLWMAGGIDLAVAEGANDIAPFIPGHSVNPIAVDLGAGFGMHAIPLARSGYAVTAIDTSDVLLGELKRHAGGLSIRAIHGDMRNFREYVFSKADLILCMGDTIAHLQELEDVERLLEQVAGALAPEGRVVITFRDHSSPLQGDARFIPVRSDSDRIHTCYLEEAGEHIVVHDLLYERESTSWRFRVSSYKKLRVASKWMLDALDRVGLKAVAAAGPRGMVRVVASAA